MVHVSVFLAHFRLHKTIDASNAHGLVLLGDSDHHVLSDLLKAHALRIIRIPINSQRQVFLGEGKHHILPGQSEACALGNLHVVEVSKDLVRCSQNAIKVFPSKIVGCPKVVTVLATIMS